jgi:hypothetical protein
MPKQITEQVINAAIDGFVAKKARLDQQIAELRAMLPGRSNGSATVPEPTTTNRRKFSAAARRRMREAQRLRWSKIRGEKIALTHKTARPKRRISAQGLKNIIDATKRRWALKRLAAAKARKAASVPKKTGAKRVARKKAA